MTSPLYQPLDAARQQIRLRYIDPHGEPDTISCAIRTFKFDEAPLYKTLSYEWGAEDNPRTIHVNHHEVQIRRNLFDFLVVHKKRCQPGGANHYTHTPRASRSRERAQKRFPLTWIDQLCIDQSNLVERSQQVGMMAEIYSNSSETLAWLGCPRSADSSGHQLSGDNELSEDIITASYWTRHWIAQEIALSRNVTVLRGDQVF